ncbi:hypothetical protein KAR91_51665 [Candidatus Pacearchaeota archaeon]|nr:hypothetical protein [Candidatus Pacearchaeota archaeon]
MKAKSKAEFKKAWKDHTAQFIHMIEPCKYEEWKKIEKQIHSLIDGAAAKLDLPDTD